MSDTVATLAAGKSVLISGASIAGPTLAYWLNRYGFDVTVVERAQSIRGGGYPIDVRGSAVAVVERMGLLAQLQAAHIDTRRLTFVDAVGQPIAVIEPEALTGGEAGRDLELPRGALTSLLFDLTQNNVQYRFGDSIASLVEHESGVNVHFKSGTHASFDIVIGADGIHSNMRRIVFGPEEQFSRYLGRCFSGFTIPNDLGLAHEGVSYTEPGRMAVLYAAGESNVLHAFLDFASPRPLFSEHSDSDQQRQLTAEMFANAGWEVPRLVEALLRANDVYSDVVSQIYLPSWSAGHVVLVGDAAHAPSFLSGQGSSLALVGAYVLAGELASHADHADAFAAYEQTMRPFAEANQALALGGASIFAYTAEELELRNRALTALAAGGELPGDASRQVHSSLRLQEYGLAVDRAARG